MNMNIKTALIISGGSIDSDCLKEYVEGKEFSPIIAVDKGLETVHKLGLNPDVVTGDFDTVDQKILDLYKNGLPKSTEPKNPPVIREFQPEKDLTDTHIAITIAIESKVEEIILWGATGTRLDHVLGNLGLMEYAYDKGIKLIIMDRNNRICLVEKEYTIKKEQAFGEFVSVIPYDGIAKKVTLKGFKYNLNAKDMNRNDSLGISNELIESEGIILCEKGRLLIVESKD